MVGEADVPGHPDAPGTVTVASPFPVPRTVDRLERAIEAAGLALFAVVDHSGAAHGIGLAMNDTKLLVFGDPRAGTPAMLAAPLLALELPLKLLVWADDRARVWITRQDAAELGRRYAVPEELMQPLAGVPRLITAALAG